MTSQQMEARLREKLNPKSVQVIDLTGTSDHFEVRIQSAELTQLSRINQHKSVMAVFADELKTGEVHALSIHVLPLEA